MDSPLNAETPTAHGGVDLNDRTTTIRLLHTRRSVVVAKMIDPGPSDDELAAILHAAIRVPDHGKLAPWRVQVVDDQGRHALGALYADLFVAANPDANAAQIAFERARPMRGPVLLVVTAKIRKPHKIPEMEQLLSAGAVCSHLLLAAHALGYVAQWLTEWPAYRPEVRSLLGHDGPDDQIVGFIHIGSPGEPPAERQRPEYDTVVETWSGPA